MKTLSIITRSNKMFSLEKVKHFITSIVLRRKRGPLSVTESLIRGLKELSAPYILNPSVSNLTETVIVITGTEALKEAIEQKKLGKIKKLLAGPCITVLPTEENGLILNSNIDTVIVPSEWVKALYISMSPELTNKITVWPAGVENVGISNKDKNMCLVYKKNCPEEILNSVEKSLKERKIKYKVLTYGNFNQNDFFNALSQSKYMIYLSPSESQGLALNEAWIRDVPTLVWDRGYWQYKDHTFKHSLISAPYLTPETGLAFVDTEDFNKTLEDFLTTLPTFTPRKYSLEHFTDKVSAKLLIDSI